MGKQQYTVPTCPDCGEPGEWVRHAEIYNGRIYNENSHMIYLCRAHRAYVGCHGNTKRPLGTMANAAMREARMKAHKAVDPYWKKGSLKRYHVYGRLSRALGREVHMGESNPEQCEEIIKVAADILPLSKAEFNQRYPKQEAS